MEMQKNNLTKLCSFYVSDWHLVTMLLPFINQKVNEKAKIATILEKDIKENVVTLVEKLNLKNKKEILSLNWNKSNEIGKIQNLQKGQELIIFINGSKEFIEIANKKLTKYMEKILISNKIKIINCYEVIEFNGSITEILDKHDKILNTSGEKEIEEVFINYEKNNQIKPKAVVGLE